MEEGGGELALMGDSTRPPKGGSSLAEQENRPAMPRAARTRHPQKKCLSCLDIELMAICTPSCCYCPGLHQRSACPTEAAKDRRSLMSIVNNTPGNKASKNGLYHPPAQAQSKKDRGTQAAEYRPPACIQPRQTVRFPYLSSSNSAASHHTLQNTTGPCSLPCSTSQIGLKDSNLAVLRARQSTNPRWAPEKYRPDAPPAFLPAPIRAPARPEACVRAT